MAVPTIVSVTPATGLTRGGNVVLITGTNFRLPSAVVGAPVTPSAAWKPEPRTVAVTFDGQPCHWAHAVTASTIRCRVPEYRGASDGTWPKALSVRVANLDDTETEIPTENATKAAAYAVDRVPRTTADSPIMRVLVELIAMLRRHVIENVWWTKSRGYDDSVVDDLDLIKQAGLPLVRLIGPDWRYNPDYTLPENPPEADAGVATAWHQDRPQTAVDLGWTVDVWSDGQNTLELENLAVGLVDTLRMLPHVRILSDPMDPASEMLEYELDMDWTGHPSFDVGPDLDGLRKFRCTLTVSGVPVGPQDLESVDQGSTVWEADSPKVSDLRPLG